MKELLASLERAGYVSIMLHIPKFQHREGEEAKILRRSYAEAGIEVPAKFRESPTTAE